MKSAYHIIVFASNADYIDSPWVYYEWDMFLTAKLKGRKNGQILTILKDVNVDDINMDLWKYESFTFENFKESILTYVKTPAYLERRHEAEKKAKIEAEKEEKKKELIRIAEEFQQKMVTLQSIDGKKILHLLQELDITNRNCPVCNNAVPISKSFCPVCGWQISPIEGIKGIGYLPTSNSEHLSLSKTLFNEKQGLLSELNSANKINKETLQRITEQEKKIDLLEKEITTLKNEQTIVHTNSRKEIAEIKPSADDKALSHIPMNGSNKITFHVKDIIFNMIHVEHGTFMMEESETQYRKRRKVKVHEGELTNNYYIGETQVTQELWFAVMGNNPSYFKGDKLPVEHVSWNECQEFIYNLNKITGKTFRLPSEAEWEFAARGGKLSKHTQYSGSNTIHDVAWYNNNSGRETHPVATKLPNELGIHDMSGNVWEWCNDWYASYKSYNYSEKTRKNPQGPTNGTTRVNRGGGWIYPAGHCRLSFRNSFSPDFNYSCLGFRLCLSE